MQGLHERILKITTAADGSATVLDTRGIFGWLYGVRWVDGDLADGVDATLSVTETAANEDYTLLTLTDANDDDWYFPREAECDNAGAAETDYAAMPLIAGRLKVVVASGGNAKSGKMLVYYFE